MTRKYKLDLSGKNFRLGSPEHLRHQKVEQAKEWASTILGGGALLIGMYALMVIAYVME